MCRGVCMGVCVSFTSVLCGLLSVTLFKTTGAQVFVKKTADKIMIVCTCVHMHAMQSHRSHREMGAAAARRDGAFKESLPTLNKASHLTAYCAWESSPHLPVAAVQLMRPDIGRNESCAVGDFA